MTRAAETERAEIVAWLKLEASDSLADGYPHDARAFTYAATHIERGDHHKDKSDAD